MKTLRNIFFLFFVFQRIWAFADYPDVNESSLLIKSQSSSNSTNEGNNRVDSLPIKGIANTGNERDEEAYESYINNDQNVSLETKIPGGDPEVIDLNNSLSANDLPISKSLEIEETNDSEIKKEKQVLGEGDKNVSLTEIMKEAFPDPERLDAININELKSEITQLKKDLSSGDLKESSASSNLGFILLVLWVPLVGWLLYQQRGKKHDKLAIKRLENSVEIINQQFSKLPVLEDFKILLSNRGKSDDTQTSEMPETPQSSEIDSLHAKLDETLRSFSTLKKTLDEKDRDIRQLRKGIDAEIYKGMIKKFIRLEEVFHQEIDTLSEDETKTKEVLSDMCEILQDTFFDCGVEVFSPEVGESIRTAFGTDDNYELVETEESSVHLQIAEVKTTGYFINSADGRKCLKESKVKVFVKKKNGEDKK